jgi:hypothetical protein
LKIHFVVCCIKASKWVFNVISDRSLASLWMCSSMMRLRSKSVGKLTKYIEHPELRGIFRWFLMTEDAWVV